MYVSCRVYSEELERALQERERIQTGLASDAMRRVSGEELGSEERRSGTASAVRQDASGAGDIGLRSSEPELDVPRRNGPAVETKGRLPSGRLYALRVRNRGAGSLSVGGRYGRPRPLSDEREMERGAGIIFGVLLAGVSWLVIVASALWFWSGTR